MRFASLGSGSRGNATLIEVGETCIMIDCGFSLRETERRLGRLGRAPQAIAAIVVTHEHADHISGVAAFAKRHAIPVYLTAGTAMQNNLGGDAEIRRFSSHAAFAIGAIEVQPYPVPHDAREPCQFVFSDGAVKLGLLTDVGSTTPHIEAVLSGCDALLLESNHEPELLDSGHYPPPLKRRVGGDLGHLSNQQAAGLLAAIDTQRLQHVIGAHLSAKHNTPALVRRAFAAALNCAEHWIGIADQDEGLAWRAVV